MKIGINLLLWTGHVTDAQAPVLQALKATGFDGVEVPVFDPSDPGHYRALAQHLDDLGLKRTAVTVIPDPAHSPIADDATARRAASDYLLRVIECCNELGAEVLAGPWFQALGDFTGQGPTEQELERCAEVHRRVAQPARDAGLICALEPLNRFECHLLNTCEQSSSYLRRLGEDGFGILYDTFHANIEEKDPVAVLLRAYDRGDVNHVHISENDRGTPGRGHAAIAETIAALKGRGYEGWLTIEAFGKALPELAAATRVWRDFFADPQDVYENGYRYIRQCWDRA
ncbi:sugar phosphate isomerase/epimerase family protein [Novosphingobium sp. Chol11]|uniref:sugar phosphate isomerase/epimerase family protein n=1 Tax=Novosphingobium sp. Chol11 TaxID=1385763 RepID=UPI000BE36650|nr:sugar phosphate isomerase/epimerase [Novosphingobium sp. Chol11]